MVLSARQREKGLLFEGMMMCYIYQLVVCVKCKCTKTSFLSLDNLAIQLVG